MTALHVLAIIGGTLTAFGLVDGVLGGDADAFLPGILVLLFVFVWSLVEWTT